MLRHLSTSTLRQQRVLSRSAHIINNSLKQSLLASHLRAARSQGPKTFTRPLSDQPPVDKSNSQSSQENGQEKVETSELVLTPGQKVVAASRLSMYLGMGAAAIACLYYIGKELIPTKMSPNSVFNSAVNILRENQEVKLRFGETFKCYGRDHGGHREGRRNFIEHTEYTSEDDGSKRTRVRFNLEGPNGKAYVFAEVSKNMPTGEFVYLLVQDVRNGRVITIVDNRAMLLAQRMAGGNAEGQKALGALLGGGKS